MSVVRLQKSMWSCASQNKVVSFRFLHQELDLICFNLKNKNIRRLFINV